MKEPWFFCSLSLKTLSLLDGAYLCYEIIGHQTPSFQRAPRSSRDTLHCSLECCLDCLGDKPRNTWVSDLMTRASDWEHDSFLGTVLGVRPYRWARQMRSCKTYVPVGESFDVYRTKSAMRHRRARDLWGKRGLRAGPLRAHILLANSGSCWKYNLMNPVELLFKNIITKNSFCDQLRLFVMAFYFILRQSRVVLISPYFISILFLF